MWNFIKNYLAKLDEGLNKLDTDTIEKITEVLAQARDEGRMIFIFGNGGSAATASHFANDLNKLASCNGRQEFKAMALTDNVPLMTAWGNDVNYDDIFSSQIKNFLNEGDVAIGISGSGNSKNILKALKLAKQKGATTIGLLGFRGGRAKDMVDHHICFEEDHYGRVEDAHMILAHLIANYLKNGY